MIPAFEASGLLPRGRFCCTADEVREVLCASQEPNYKGKTRGDLWDDFLALVDLLRAQRIRVPAAFVSGSFVTSFATPSDVDASLLVDASRITRQETWAKAEHIAVSAKPVGLEVDARLIPWYPASAPPALAEVTAWTHRGWWDDFWQRHVPKAERDPWVRAHAMPVRGYLEVILDDYS